MKHIFSTSVYFRCAIYRRIGTFFVFGGFKCLGFTFSLQEFLKSFGLSL